MKKKMQGDDVLAMFGCITSIVVEMFPLPPFIPIDRVSAGDSIPNYVRSSPPARASLPPSLRASVLPSFSAVGFRS
jgi:hypothetical protein